MKKNFDFKKLLLFCLFLAPSAYCMNDSEYNGFSDIFDENWEQNPTTLSYFSHYLQQLVTFRIKYPKTKPI